MLNLSQETKDELAREAVDHPSLMRYLEKLEITGRRIWNEVHRESAPGSIIGDAQPVENVAEEDHDASPEVKKADGETDPTVDGPTPAA